jgi:hypothetical protein
MTIAGMPSEFAADESAAAAWQHGRDDADTAHAYAETYREVFPLTVGAVPFLYADGSDGILCRAYRDGYATRAQDLADGSADETPWHLREPAPGATYPPMGERQG